MLRFTGIPVGQREWKHLATIDDVPAQNLSLQDIEMTLAALSNGKGEPPMLHTPDAKRFWACMQEFAFRKALQANALVAKTESEKGK